CNIMVDSKDEKILEALEENPKRSISSLALRIRSSKAVAEYRLRRLEKNGVISHFGTVFNPAIVGYEQYRVFFSFNSISESEKERILAFLRKQSCIYWAALIGFKWDLLTVVYVEDYTTFERFMESVFAEFPKEIKSYDAAYTLEHEFYSHKFLEKKSRGRVPASTVSIDSSSVKQVIPLDKLDLDIIDLIMKDARASSLSIASRCRVNYKTVQNRIKRMENCGLICGYRTFLNSEKLGFRPYLVLVSFHGYAKLKEKQVLAYAKAHPLITQTTRLFGKWNLLLHFRVKDESELQRTLSELKSRFDVIGDCEVVRIFSNVWIEHFPIRNIELRKARKLS
ncbi:Lrp/AsnC family transcriptional regulator, partial [Candidatus Woesearchaeota archaeon]|nr:Lrp/AsnC family transcriptional regulator [Candidatus Woesearchaeota archaeon]